MREHLRMEDPMLVLRTLLASSALFCLANTVYAADVRDPGEGMAWASTPDGSYSAAQLSDRRIAEAMTTAKPVPAGAVIFVHRGKLYFTEPYGDRIYGDYTY
jgi:hypothetical protein